MPSDAITEAQRRTGRARQAGAGAGRRGRPRQHQAGLRARSGLFRLLVRPSRCSSYAGRAACPARLPTGAGRAWARQGGLRSGKPKGPLGVQLAHACARGYLPQPPAVWASKSWKDPIIERRARQIREDLGKAPKKQKHAIEAVGEALLFRVCDLTGDRRSRDQGSRDTPRWVVRRRAPP